MEARLLDTLDLRLLRIFRTVVNAGGFSAAQGALNLSLPTISSHIANLETRLGLRLCRRGRSGFQLTDDGQAIYEELLRLDESLDRFEARLRRLTGELGGNFALGLADNTISDPAAPLDRLFARFVEKAPQVTLEIVTRPPDELLRDLAAGKLQLALASFPTLAQGFGCRTLYTETQHFYCGIGHPLFGRDGAQVTLEEIQRHRIVARHYWGARDMKVFSIPTPQARVSDMEAGARLILSGCYLGYLPEHYARSHVEAGRMRAIRPDLLSYHASFQAVYDMSHRSDRNLSLFLSLLDEVFPG